LLARSALRASLALAAYGGSEQLASNSQTKPYISIYTPYLILAGCFPLVKIISFHLMTDF